MFFAKERFILCVRLGLISRQKLEKGTEKNGTFLVKSGKERNIPNGKERGAQPCKKCRKSRDNVSLSGMLGSLSGVLGSLKCVLGI